MSSTANTYARTADALTDRIVALGPQILALDDAWKLLRAPGFQCDDLAPSLAQADFALAKAKSILARTADPGGTR